MFKEIEDILNENITITEKLDKLESLEKQFDESIKKAHEKAKEGFKYCKYCNQYYKEKAWEIQTYKGIRNICTYWPLAEFEDATYEDKEVLIEAHICPLGHKEEIY